VKLLIQPGNGVLPLVRGINGAKESVEIGIFRFDRGEIERALKGAVNRGVSVRALIAHTNRGGEAGLRKLELRLLAAGVAVARTATDLARYHGKLMIIDHRHLYLTAFNLTYQDIERSRSFGVITGERKVVEEASRLFECDTRRLPYTARHTDLVVSPGNAREQLAAFIRGTRKQLLIYDPKISDAAMARSLQERAEAGVEIKLLGRLTRRHVKLEARKLSPLRLHTRTMIRDGQRVFIGSQSLRETELDARREIGIIFRDSRLAKRLIKVFEEDWSSSGKETLAAESENEPAGKAAKIALKVLEKELPPVGSVLRQVIKETVGEGVWVDREKLDESVKDAMKSAVAEAVHDVVEEAVERNKNGEA
jgi:cardiolipin synthase A/B